MEKVTQEYVSVSYVNKVMDYNNLNGSFKYNCKQYQVCLNIADTKAFSSTVTKKECKINHKFNCNEKCLIYVITCNKWMLQYVGKTINKFQPRQNNYNMNSRSFVTGQTCLQ